MKTNKILIAFLLLLLFLSCAKKAEIKVYDFYNVMNSALTEEENENGKILSGSINIDENQSIVNILINGTDYSLNYRIVEKNKPVYFENFTLLMSKVGFDDCSDAYKLSSVNAMEDNTILGEGEPGNTSMLYFTSIESRNAAILMTGSDFMIFGVSKRKNN